MQEERRDRARHIFAVGSMVRLRSVHPFRNAAGGSYEVLAKLPAQDGVLQYRVKSVSEPHQRILKEDELEQA